MYIPIPQSLLTASLALTSTLLSSNSKSIISGRIMDYAVEKCVDADANIRCSRPFSVTNSTCYALSWTTTGKLTHTTVEVRDVGSDEIVYYRDTDGEWEAEKTELVYLDFKPKVWMTGNETVEFEVKTCT